LGLGRTQVSNAGLTHLKTLTNLSILKLNDSPVSDAGLTHLKPLTNLSTLYLVRTQVSDAGLASLEGLKSLRHLDLTGTKVTDKGVDAFRKALPKCRILPDERGVAEWALPRGGWITIRLAGGEREVRAVKDLPAGTFQVTRLSLTDVRFTDAELACL